MKIGSGGGKAGIRELTTQTEVVTFLRSEESDYMYAMDQIDIAMMANMFNLNIHNYMYNRSDGTLDGWTQVTFPDPMILSSFCTYTDRPALNLTLYNCDSSPHYDLLVTPDSRLATLGSVTMRQNESTSTDSSISVSSVAPSEPPTSALSLTGP